MHTFASLFVNFPTIATILIGLEYQSAPLVVMEGGLVEVCAAVKQGNLSLITDDRFDTININIFTTDNLEMRVPGGYSVLAGTTSGMM